MTERLMTRMRRVSLRVGDLNWELTHALNKTESSPTSSNTCVCVCALFF